MTPSSASATAPLPKGMRAACDFGLKGGGDAEGGIRLQLLRLRAPWGLSKKGREPPATPVSRVAMTKAELSVTSSSASAASPLLEG